MNAKLRSRSLGLLALLAVVLPGMIPARAAETSEAVNQAKKRVSDADGQVRKAMAGLTIEATRIAKAAESAPAWQKAMADLKEAQDRSNKAARTVKAALTADPNYKKALAERTRWQDEKETLRADPKATPEQRTEAALATLKAASDVGKIEQQAMEDDPEVAKARAAMSQAQYTLDELRRSAMATAAKDPGVLAAKQKVDAAKVQLADAEKQLQDAKKQQARADEQKMDDEIQNKQNLIFNLNRGR